MNEVAEQSAQKQSSGVAYSLGSSNKAFSVPTWDGSTPEQRMELMREEVRCLRRRFTELTRAVRRFKAHQHSQDGSILVPFRNSDDEDSPPGYFYDPLK